MDLAAEVSYIRSYLKEEEESGWWHILYVAQLMKTAAVILQGVYDSYCLWAIPPRCIHWLCQREPSLEIALGTHRNADEFLSLLDVM